MSLSHAIAPGRPADVGDEPLALRHGLKGAIVAPSVRLHELADSGRGQQVFDAWGVTREGLSRNHRRRLALEYAAILVDQQRYGELQIMCRHVGLGPPGEKLRVSLLNAALSLEAGEAGVVLRFLTLKPAPKTLPLIPCALYTLQGLAGAALNDSGHRVWRPCWRGRIFV